MKISTCFAIIIVFLSLNIGFGQSKSLSEIDKSTKKTYQKAVKYFKSKKISKAKKKFKHVIEKEPLFIKPYLYLASINFDEKNYKKCADYYKEVIDIDSIKYVDAFYSLGIALENQKNYNEALKNYKRHIANATTDSKYYKKSKDKVKRLSFFVEQLKNPIDFNPIPLNESINTTNNEYLPAITGDNSMIIFTRRIRGKEDFYNAKWILVPQSMKNIRRMWQEKVFPEFHVFENGKIVKSFAYSNKTTRRAIYDYLKTL